MQLALDRSASSAVFSECRRYRYRLWRRWSDASAMLFLLLNPSRADETLPDATISRCMIRARDAGYGALEVVNIFAWRSTDPSGMKAADDPVGPDNDRHILNAVRDSGIVVCGWGRHGTHLGRGNAVLALLRSAGTVPHVLKLNGDGSPAHPLYLGYGLRPVAMGVQ